MTKYVTEELELDPETLTKLKEMSEEYNTTIDNIVNEILVNYISERIKIDDFKKLFDQEPLQVLLSLGKYYTIVDDNEKPIAQFTPKS